ncbi:unnamed protein product [Lactuca saligna]|uniref:Cysteine-rich receptor-like protein kinase 2 n=1 Tax=Lactuca saligna TaxID=75948 RepID=A0AA35YLX5_LACSI|nr:unnamed protein product [Lactuca saligna]
MRLNTNLRSWWWVASVLVILVLMDRPVTSQKIDRNNTMIRWYCSSYRGMNSQVFLKNLNTTLSSLRKQLSRVNNYHAVSKAVINGESVFGLALCREYLPTSACLSCFDTAVSYMKVCGLGNGAHIFYDDCEIRYENRNFYNDAIVKTSIAICGNTTSSYPKELKKVALGLLSDLRIATPKTSNFFAASTRQITGSNATVYAIAQCIRNISESMCVECLKIRSRFLDDCLPSTLGRAIDDGCFMRYSETPFFQINQTTDITPLLRNAIANEKIMMGLTGYSRNLRFLVGGVVGGVCMLLCILGFLFWHHRSRKSKNSRKDKSTGETDMLQRTTIYTYKDLKMATNNFSDHNKIGGGFDRLYKGVLKDANTVAIKKIDITSKSGKGYMDNEMQIISNVHHRYLIRLLGYCRKGRHLYFVLEYMENGSLDKFLYGDKRGTLNWRQRFDIIYGTARGLAYLHEQYHVKIIHRNIKASNILLDDVFQPKITDFGQVKLLPQDKTHLSTKVTGTLSNGYNALEYENNGQLSEKDDIYSFGVVMLEIISGKWCNDMLENESATMSLVDLARSLYDNEMHLNIIDVTLDQNEYAIEDAKKIVEIALMCTHSTASLRPTMSDVVILLSERSFSIRRPMMSTIDDCHMNIQVNTSTSTSKYETNGTSSTYGSPVD